MLRIFWPETSKNRSRAGRSFFGVSCVSIRVGMGGELGRRSFVKWGFAIGESCRHDERALSKPAQMKAAVDVKDFAGAKRKQILCERGHRAPDILGCTPALDGSEPFANQLLIFVMHACRHVR